MEDGRIAFHSIRGSEHRRQHLVLHLYQSQRLLGLMRTGRRHGSHSVPLIERLVTRQDIVPKILQGSGAFSQFDNLVGSGREILRGGYSEDALLRAADVVLKENKKLILVPRETPLNLVHVKNMELLMQAGAILLPANPFFYSGAKTLEDLADTVVARVLDQMGIAHDIGPRWTEEAD